MSLRTSGTIFTCEQVPWCKIMNYCQIFIAPIFHKFIWEHHIITVTYHRTCSKINSFRRLSENSNEKRLKRKNRNNGKWKIKQSRSKLLIKKIQITTWEYLFSMRSTQMHLMFSHEILKHWISFHTLLVSYCTLHLPLTGFFITGELGS